MKFSSYLYKRVFVMLVKIAEKLPPSKNRSADINKHIELMLLKLNDKFNCSVHVCVFQCQHTSPQDIISLI